MKRVVDRYEYLNRYGYPNPMSAATGNNIYFEDAFVTNYGIWAYIHYKIKIPFISDIVFFIGDPSCSREYLTLFITEAIEALSRKGKIVIIQAHKQTVEIAENIRSKRLIIHQFGNETQVLLPIALTEQIGTKVRSALKNGLYTEEIVFTSDEIDESIAGYKTKINFNGIIAKYERVDNKNSIECHGELIYTKKNDTQLSSIKLFMENEVENTKRTKEFSLKIDRYNSNILPENIKFFYISGDNIFIKIFGYMLDSKNGTTYHYLFFKKVDNVKREVDLLLPGKKMATKNDLMDLEVISKEWLNNKTNKQEMGPPMLKPYIPQKEYHRRFFVARNNRGRIVAFVDFDRIDFSDNNGILDLNKRGYYTNLVRSYIPEGNNIYLKHVRFLIISAAAKRFFDEGYSHINLGLSPIVGIKKENVIRKIHLKKKLSIIELMFKYISTSKIANHFTFNYNNVSITKQRNWKDISEPPVYLVVEGRFFRQMISTFFLFVRAGVLTKYSYYKILKK